ncbi:hypothetical protein QTP86_016104 [Hemibagrus guttatus]|nr:hypothetical protein QTP86_016104 [Hemibagrus guttatus]
MLEPGSRRGEDNKLHLCAFFSHRLTLTEKNNHVRDRELLAVKLALEEWWHWLEGAKHPFQVLTDHKNLEYIQQAKRLNAHQVCWSLLFNQFQFILSYCPGSKNLKLDALSRVYGCSNDGGPIMSIILSSKIVVLSCPEFQNKVGTGNGSTTSPSSGTRSWRGPGWPPVCP